MALLLSTGGGYDTSELLILAVHVRRPAKSYQRRVDVCVNNVTVGILSQEKFPRVGHLAVHQGKQARRITRRRGEYLLTVEQTDSLI